jgi:GTP-binding protein HflX
VLLSDTVGFVRNLPHMLVEAFRSTMEVTAEADVLIHVVDGSASDPDGQIDAVKVVLDEIGADRVPQLVVFNKADRVPTVDDLLASHPGSVAISALSGDGVEEMLRTLADRLRSLATVVELVIPWDRGDVLAAVHREGEVISELHTDEGVRIRARLDAASAGKLHQFVAD